MNKRILPITVIILFLFSSNANAQLNLIGLSASTANINESSSDLNTQLMGLAGFVEFPLQNISAQLEYSYYTPTSKHENNLPEIEDLVTINMYIGKILRHGQQFQIPLHIGGGRTISNGDIKFKNIDIGAKVGARYYFAPRFAVFSNVSANYVLASDFTYTNKMGISETSDLKPLLVHLNFGIAFSYLK